MNKEEIKSKIVKILVHLTIYHGTEGYDKDVDEFFSLFLDMADSLVPESINGYSLPDDYYLLGIGKKLIGEHRREAYNQAIDQFKEKIEELRGGEK